MTLASADDGAMMPHALQEGARPPGCVPIRSGQDFHAHAVTGAGDAPIYAGCYRKSPGNCELSVSQRRGCGRKVMTGWRTYAVTVKDFHPVTYAARSPAAARAAAYADYSESRPVTLKDFFQISTVRRCSENPEAGYGYIRSQYGVDIRAGQRIRIKDEGEISGREGEAIYPGQYTAHVHVALDGDDRLVIIHPLNIEILP